MIIRQFIHQMNYSEVKDLQSYVRVSVNLVGEVEMIIPRDTPITFKGKYDGKDLSSTKRNAATFPSFKNGKPNYEIGTIGTIVSTYNVQPGDLIIFEKRENDDKIYIDCIKRNNVISVLRRAKNSDYYEILNESVLEGIKFPVKAMFDGVEYSLSIEDDGSVKKRSNSKSQNALRPQYKIKIGNELFHKIIRNMDDFNIFNIEGQYVIEKNIKNNGIIPFSLVNNNI